MSDFRIAVTGVATPAKKEGALGRYELEIDGQSLSQAVLKQVTPDDGDPRGIITAIISSEKSLKHACRHDVYQASDQWDAWASTIETEAIAGDLIAVGSNDAIGPVPEQEGKARSLLTSIGASKIFKVTKGVRRPYALIFVKGQTTSVEDLGREYEGQLTSETTYETLGGRQRSRIAFSAPFDFRLSNRLDQTVLYTRLLEQDLKLELCNTSRSLITIAAASTEEDWHVQLCFRPGTLWNPRAVRLDDDAWRMQGPDAPSATDTAAATARPHAVIFRFRYSGTEPLELEPLHSTILMLRGVSVDGRSGSRGTRVELNYRNLRAAGSDEPLHGTCMHYLSVMDERPADEPGTAPIAIDWAGPDTFVNNGSATKRILRLYNQSGRSLSLAAAKITIEIPIDPAAGWALVQSPKAVRVEELAGWRRRGHSGELPIELEPEGSDQQFADKTHIDIPITLESQGASGPAAMAVRYEGFEHLQATHRLVAHKTPLVVSGDKVGIGTAEPQAMLDVGGDLHVAGDVDVTGDIGVTGAISVTGDLDVGGKLTNANEDGVIHASGRYRDKHGPVMPVGAILPYAGQTAPDGWLLCDGTPYKKTDFSDLASVLGETYGTSSSDSFCVPDLRGRGPLGVDPHDKDFALGKMAGAKTAKLEVKHLPNHTHSVIDQGHSHEFDVYDGNSYPVAQRGDTRKKTSQHGETKRSESNISLGCTGNNVEHENLPPYLTVNFIIKY